MNDFSAILGHALYETATKNGAECTLENCLSWGKTGAMYLAHVLCAVPVDALRSQQYYTREEFGPMTMDCRWYDTMCDICLNGNSLAAVSLIGPDGLPHECDLDKELFLEMLDFCREG